MYITIENDGPEIRETNFWDTEIGNTKYAYAMNAGCLRVLIPIEKEHLITEMTACDYAIVSTIANPKLGRLGIEILFEDHSKAPFCLHLCPDVGIGFYPMVAAKPVEKSLSVWIKGPKKVGAMKAYFRKVPRLPYLKPL